MRTVDELVHRGRSAARIALTSVRDLAARDGRRGDATGGGNRKCRTLAPDEVAAGCAADSEGGAIGCPDAA